MALKAMRRAQRAAARENARQDLPLIVQSSRRAAAIQLHRQQGLPAGVSRPILPQDDDAGT
jgi:hypothetical protein